MISDTCRFPSSLVFVSVTKIAGIWHIIREFYWLSQFALIFTKTKSGKVWVYFSFAEIDLQLSTCQ